MPSAILLECALPSTPGMVPEKNPWNNDTTKDDPWSNKRTSDRIPTFTATTTKHYNYDYNNYFEHMSPSPIIRPSIPISYGTPPSVLDSPLLLSSSVWTPLKPGEKETAISWKDLDQQHQQNQHKLFLPNITGNVGYGGGVPAAIAVSSPAAFSSTASMPCGNLPPRMICFPRNWSPQDDDDVSLLNDDPDDDDAAILPQPTYDVLANIFDDIYKDESEFEEEAEDDDDDEEENNKHRQQPPSSFIDGACAA